LCDSATMLAPSPADSEAAPSPAALTRFLIIVGFCGFASALSMRTLDPVMPLIAVEFERSVVEVALLTTWFTFFYAFGQPILGPIGDAFSKPRLISLALVAMSATTAVAAAAGSFGLFSVARGLTGIAAGGVIPLVIAMIGDRFPYEQRQVALARFMVATLTGQIMGGLASGVLSPLIGWRGVLSVIAAIAGVSGIVFYLAMGRRDVSKRRPFSIGQAIANYRDILANPRALPLYLLVACEGALAFGFFPYVAAILLARDGATSVEAGIVITGYAIGGMIFAFSAKWILKSLGEKGMIRLGGVILCLCFLLFSIPAPWWTALPIFMMIGFGVYNIHNNLQTQATTLSETARGSSVALFACLLFAGSACGPPLVGLLMRLAGESGALLLYAAGVLALGLSAPRLLKLDRKAN